MGDAYRHPHGTRLLMNGWGWPLAGALAFVLLIVLGVPWWGLVIFVLVFIIFALLYAITEMGRWPG